MTGDGTLKTDMDITMVLTAWEHHGTGADTTVRSGVHTGIPGATVHGDTVILTHGITEDSTTLGITEDFMTRGTAAVTGADIGADIGDGMTRGIIIITITDGMTLITTDLLI